MKYDLKRRAISEGLGTAFLLAAVIGSGIMGERLANGNEAMVLLVNAVATGAALIALISSLEGISGAHFNPVVTLSDVWLGRFPWRETPAYIVAQLSGAFLGVVVAHLMFGLPVLSASSHVRTGSGLLLGEFVATFGLLLVIYGSVRFRPATLPFAVAGYIAAAYWFTSSTSFANPAVTLARAASDTFAGIRPSDAPWFIGAQLTGALAATLLVGWLIPRPSDADRELTDHD